MAVRVLDLSTKFCRFLNHALIFEPCIDFVVVSASGMQNGSPDGKVLYDTNSVIVDSLSYEGNLMNGGWNLKDISVTSEKHQPILQLDIHCKRLVQVVTNIVEEFNYYHCK